MRDPGGGGAGSYALKTFLEQTLHRRCPSLVLLLRNKSVLVLLCFLSAVAWPQDRSHQDFVRRLITAAVERTHHQVSYVSEYVHIPYPGGDVPSDTGVCTDEVIRSYRAVGIDLQKEVHEDMVRHFDARNGSTVLIPISITGASPTS